MGAQQKPKVVRRQPLVSISEVDVRTVLRQLGLSGRPVCVHCSLSSFGHVEGGGKTLVRAFLEERTTLLAPSFSWGFAVPPPASDRPPRNGTRYDFPDRPPPERAFTPESREVDRDMGALARTVVLHTERERGDHPLCSFSAVGPLASDLIEVQRPNAVWAPLERLAAADGSVILMGVGLTRLSLIHLAEEAAGRRPFIRWTLGPDGTTQRVRVGGCSEGFESLRPVLEGKVLRVGMSQWFILRAAESLHRLTGAIREEPDLTKCGDPACLRCRDAVAGGPIR